MGAKESKIRIKVPSNPCCFPGYKDETQLFQTTKRIEDCHMHALQATSWIASTLFPAYCPPAIVFSAATILFAFLIERISGSLSATKSNGSQPAPETAECSIKRSEKTLEDALIDSKVSNAIARKSVCELQAKICVVQNRFQRLLSNISPDDRRLEVVPAIQTCEEILQLFHDEAHVFRQFPLVSSPFLVLFAGIFVAVAELSLVLIPSYKEPLIREMKLMTETLMSYKRDCIQQRIDGIKFRSLHPASMMDAVAGVSEFSYKMEDSCVPKKDASSSEQRSNNEETESTKEEELDSIYQSGNEAIVAYKTALEEKYSKFFDTAIETISKFSGFKNDTMSNEGTEELEIFSTP